MTRRPARLVLMIALLPLAAHAAPVLQDPQTFQPFSSTATAITGPVTLSQDKITFGNGASATMHLIGDRDGAWGYDDSIGPAQVFQVTSDPGELLNGNFLCSEQSPVRYLVAQQSQSYGAWGLTLLAFNGDAQPASMNAPGLCATFGYGIDDGPITGHAPK